MSAMWVDPMQGDRDKGPGITMMLTSAGRRVELLQAFRQSAAAMGVRLRIIACDAEPAMSAACHVADVAFAVPPADRDDYVAAVLDIAVRERVRLVVPTIDPELLPLARASAAFAGQGIHVSVSDEALIAIARDKQHTAEFLRSAGIRSPRSALLDVARADPAAWPGPLFLKPVHGSAGRGVRPIASLAAMDGVAQDELMLVQALLEGPEYTVNCYFDLDGKLCSVVPHRRLKVRAGEVEKGQTCRHMGLLAMARQLAGVLPGPRGALCFQAIIGADGEPSMFEINARFGGGYPLAHRAGAPFARWLLEDVLGRPSTASDNWTEGLTMLRHDVSVFVAS